MLARFSLAGVVLLAAGWAAAVTAIALDSDPLASDTADRDALIQALSDEVERLEARLAALQAPPAAVPAVVATAAPTPTAAAEPTPTAIPEQAASSGFALPRAAGAPPAPAESRGAAQATEEAALHGLSAELGPPRVPDTFPGIIEPPVTYRLQQGEALLHVAERFDVTVEELAAANRIFDVDSLPVGMLLIIP